MPSRNRASAASWLLRDHLILVHDAESEDACGPFPLFLKFDQRQNKALFSIRLLIELQGFDDAQSLSLSIEPANITQCSLDTADALPVKIKNQLVLHDGISSDADVLQLSFSLTSPGCVIVPASSTPISPKDASSPRFLNFYSFCRSKALHFYFPKNRLKEAQRRGLEELVRLAQKGNLTSLPTDLRRLGGDVPPSKKQDSRNDSHKATGQYYNSQTTEADEERTHASDCATTPQPENSTPSPSPSPCRPTTTLSDAEDGRSPPAYQRHPASTTTTTTTRTPLRKHSPSLSTPPASTNPAAPTTTISISAASPIDLHATIQQAVRDALPDIVRETLPGLVRDALPDVLRAVLPSALRSALADPPATAAAALAHSLFFPAHNLPSPSSPSPSHHPLLSALLEPHLSTLIESHLPALVQPELSNLLAAAAADAAADAEEAASLRLREEVEDAVYEVKDVRDECVREMGEVRRETLEAVERKAAEMVEEAAEEMWEKAEGVVRRVDVGLGRGLGSESSETGSEGGEGDEERRARSV
ncbi:Centrosome-associated protein cep250 [Lasiodiplodia theobromae]|uniref:Centrosome-associated protein cep250 n=1 Tax=Lasiodiplodia theobromae TaxID=45133 RepID=UPI0015C31DF3|nr:Centrosome-associated protein cep250 [Lasiodiplodia theobromae]KAF4539213.1 Centrosome-associated protein cep250 [Lasiodiplodia theobromae]